LSLGHVHIEKNGKPNNLTIFRSKKTKGCKQDS